MSNDDTFYCGLNQRLLFKQLEFRFNCPLSTTESFGIAQNFQFDHVDGIILELKYDPSLSRYFNTEFFSGYSNEKERLICYSDLKISNIFHYGTECKHYLIAMGLEHDLEYECAN